MAKPWEKYGSSATAKKPWERYAEQGDPELLSSYEDEAPEPPKPGIIRRAADTGIDLIKGAVDLGQGVVGLGSMATGGLVGKGMRAIGYDPEATNQFLDQGYSDARKQAEAEVTGAQGFVGKAGALLDNPSALAGRVARTVPSMLGLAAGARAAAAKAYTTVKEAEIAAGVTEEVAIAKASEAAKKVAVGWSAGLEGAQQAGSSFQGKQQDGVDLGTNYLTSIGSGVTTALLSRGSSAILPDVEASIATRNMGVTDLLNPGKSKGIVRRVGEGVVKEGVIEEMPQSATEQMWGNYAYDKPLTENVAESAAEGLVVGGAAGGGFNLVGGNQRNIEAEALGRQRAEESALAQAQQQAEAQKVAAEEKSVRDANRTYYAEQLPFETFKKQRVEEITNEQLTPEIIENAYQEAFKTAVEQELAPPTREKFEKQYKGQVKKEIAKNTDELTQEYYETLDNMAATGVDLLGDPTELNTEGTAEPEAQVDSAVEPPANRRQMDFLGELDRTVQPGYSPVMPVATPGEGTPASTTFTQTPVDDRGLPGALQEAKARAQQGGVTIAPPNAGIVSNPLMSARDAALRNGVSKGTWAKFVSSRNLIGADSGSIAEAIRDRAINGSGSNNPAWEAAHSALIGKSIDDYLSEQEKQNEGVQTQTSNEEASSEVPAERAATALAQAKISAPAVVVPELATQQKRVYDTLVAAAQDGDLENYVASDGTINYQRIADKMGIPRQSAKAAIDQTVKRFEQANGGTLREKLANRTKAVRTTEAADEDMLGTSPANFTKGSLQVGAKLDKADLFGDDTGAGQSFGVVETVGGSQSEVGKAEDVPLDNKPDPVAERRQAEAVARNTALQTEALSRPEAAEAAADWDDMRSPTAPFAKDLSRQDAYDWLMNYMEFKYGDITEEALAADQLDIERRYDADPQKAVGLSGRDADGRTAKPQVAEGGRKAEAPARSETQEDAGVQNENAKSLTPDDIPKGTKVKLTKLVAGKTKSKSVDARKAMLAAQQRVEKLKQLRACLG